MMKPLEGIKVLDLTTALNGPFCTMILADYGAEVIKIETPHGEMGRELDPILPKEQGGESGFFIQFNRNKKGVTLNLKNEKALSMFYDLVKTADVVVENYKGGTTKKLKIDYDTLKEIKPDLIYVSSSGFGQDSPMSHRPCFDAVAQAMSGLVYLTGFPDSDPVKVGPSVIDHTTGMNAAIGTLLALYVKKCTGKGQHVDVAMIDTAFSILESGIPEWTMAHHIPERIGNVDMTISPFDSFPCKDGFIFIGVGSTPAYKRMCEAMGRIDLYEDPRFRTNHDRFVNFQEYLRPEIVKWSRERTKAEIDAIMEEYSVPCGPIYNMKEACESETIRARNMLVHSNHPTAGDVEIQNCVIKFSETPGSVETPAPLLGQHNAEVFDLTEEEVEKLKAEGVM